jgi:hypothetical protein
VRSRPPAATRVIRSNRPRTPRASPFRHQPPVDTEHERSASSPAATRGAPARGRRRDAPDGQGQVVIASMVSRRCSCLRAPQHAGQRRLEHPDALLQLDIGEQSGPVREGESDRPHRHPRIVVLTNC